MAKEATPKEKVAKALEANNKETDRIRVSEVVKATKLSPITAKKYMIELGYKPRENKKRKTGPKIDRPVAKSETFSIKSASIEQLEKERDKVAAHLTKLEDALYEKLTSYKAKIAELEKRKAAKK